MPAPAQREGEPVPRRLCKVDGEEKHSRAFPCKTVPTWLKPTSDVVKEQIHKLAKKGLTPSQTGIEDEVIETQV
ncbi:hypothetical protein GH733_005502 [Mirounga leonina]|nr:hypothetical protein GH733_005502 [Mirounga leonina]